MSAMMMYVKVDVVNYWCPFDIYTSVILKKMILCEEKYIRNSRLEHFPVDAFVGISRAKSFLNRIPMTARYLLFSVRYTHTLSLEI